MTFLDRIRNGLSRGLDVFRDIPVVQEPQPQPQPQQVSRPAPVAIQTSGWSSQWIDEEDLDPVGLAWRPGEWFALAQMRTPETAHFRIMNGERRLRLYFKGQKTVAGQTLASPGARTVNLPFLVETPQAKPSLPTAYHPEVSVWAQVGGVWQRLTITAIDYATGNVTFTEPAGITGTIEIYYTHGDGQMRFRVARDAGGIDDSTATVFNQSFATLHSIDQNSLETMIAWPQQVELVPGTRLVLEVFTNTVPMVWNDRAGHYVHIAALARRVDVLDKGRLLSLAEIENRGGL
jgi:hypothetical protein